MCSSDLWTEKYAEDTEKGTGSWFNEYTAAGSVTLKDKVTVYDDITCYANVNIKNSSVNDIIAWRSLEGLEGASTWAVVAFTPAYGYYKSQENYTTKGSSNTTEYKAIGAVTLDNASAGSISGFAKVTLKNNSTADDIVGGFNSKYTESYTEANDKFSSTYTVKSANNLVAENSVINGDVSGFGTVQLTNSNVGSVSGVIALTEKITDTNYESVAKAAGKFTFTANAKTAASELYTIGNISDFKDVSITGVADVKKNIFIAVEVTGDIAGVNSDVIGTGALTLKNNVLVKGNIENFNKADITNCNVLGRIANTAAVTLNAANVFSGIDSVQKLTIANKCAIDSYNGTDFNDTVTLNKDSVLAVANGLNFGSGIDKFTINGTLILTSAIDFNNIGLENLTGSGVIVADSTVYANTIMQAGSKVKLVNLGNTTAGFRGEKLENADNTAKKAVTADWDATEINVYELDGWLGKGLEIEDTCDWIKFEAWADGEITFNGLGAADTIDVNGTIYTGNATFDIVADTDYKICITRNEDDSVQYYATMQLS